MDAMLCVLQQRGRLWNYRKNCLDHTVAVCAIFIL